MASSDPYLALDIGAGNGRAILGLLDDDRIELHELHRFENKPVLLNGTLYWDLLSLWDNVLYSLKKAASSGFSCLAGIGIDAFNCDFGLLDRGGNLLGNPISYRDRGSASVLGCIEEKIGEDELYHITGIGFNSITALARFVYLKETFGKWYLDNAAHYLPLPDLFRFYLTGHAQSDETILWGSQLVDIRTRLWHDRLIDLFEIPHTLLPDIVRPGTVTGALTDEIREMTGMKNTPLIAVAGHDTISASIAHTDRAQEAAFVSIGTWSILGVLLGKPETGPEAHRSGFLNEIAVDSILFARNLMGFYVLEGLIRSWKMRGIETDYERLIEEARHAPEFALSIDVNDPIFFSAVNMEDTLNTYLHTSGQKATEQIGVLVRSILESLAVSYARAVEDLGEIFGTRVARLTVLGGGGRNRLLCQMIADAADTTTVTGPAEATVIGNIVTQARATGRLQSMNALHTIMANSSEQTVFKPRNHSVWKKYVKRRGV